MVTERYWFIYHLILRRLSKMKKDKTVSIWVSEANHVFRNYTIRACGIDARQTEFLAYKKYKEECEKRSMPPYFDADNCRKFIEYFGAEAVKYTAGEVTFE
jgi:hypothetical protein